MKQYIEVTDLRGNVFYINGSGTLTPDVNKAHGFPKRAVPHVLKQLEEARLKEGSVIASFRARPFKTR